MPYAFHSSSALDSEKLGGKTFNDIVAALPPGPKEDFADDATVARLASAEGLDPDEFRRRAAPRKLSTGAGQAHSEHPQSGRKAVLLAF